MLPSFLGIVAQGGGGPPPPPPSGVLISEQTLDVTYLTTTPAETFNFGGGSTYLTNGESVTDFNYTSDPSTAFDLDLTGLSSLITANVYDNALMTAAPDLTGLTALNFVAIFNNPLMASAPDFTGCTSLVTATVLNTLITSAPNFTGLTALTTINVSLNAAMTTAPDVTGCSSVSTVIVNGNAISDSNLLALCVQIYASAPAGGYLSMQGGTNGSFDGLSLPSQITDLQNNGWTVLFNDINPP